MCITRAKVISASVCVCVAAEGGNAPAWKEVLGQAQQSEQLSRGRKPLRKLMLMLHGDHTAYHDAKAHIRLVQAYKVTVVSSNQAYTGSKSKHTLIIPPYCGL